jgi:hypothetical protein
MLERIISKELTSLTFEPESHQSEFNYRLELLRDRDRVQVEGFQPVWERFGVTNEDWLLTRIAGMGYPVDNITTVSLTNNTQETQGVLGSYTHKGQGKGKFEVYKLNEKFHPIVLFGVLAHELQHQTSPFTQENATLYGSEENRLKAVDFATKAARQSEVTRVFLNNYHKSHFEKLLAAREELGNELTEESGKALERAEWLFREETLAIIAELRFANPEHLRQVQDAQLASLVRRANAPGGEKDLPEGIYLTSHEYDGGVEADGIDKIMINLIPEVDDVVDLQSHIAAQKMHFRSPNSIASLNPA